MTAALAAVLVIGGLTMGAALAVDDPGTATYTGCLNPASGTVSKLKAGPTPVKSCPAGDTTVTFGGGDVTSVVAGTGLTGGATEGQATLDLAGSYRLPQDCVAPDVVAKWSGSGWDCAPDDNTTYDGNDFATSDQSCSTGQVVTGVDTDGDVTCATDKDTTYDGADFATSGQSCTTGQVVTGVGASGGLTCTSLPATGSSLVRGTYRNGASNLVNINHYTKGKNEIGSVDLPSAGPWMITVTGVIDNFAGALLGNGRSTFCDLFGPSGSSLQRTGVKTTGNDNGGPLGIQFAGNLAAGHYSVGCFTIGGTPDDSDTGVLWMQVNAQSFVSVS